MSRHLLLTLLVAASLVSAGCAPIGGFIAATVRGWEENLMSSTSIVIATFVSTVLLLPVARAQQAEAPAPSMKAPAPLTMTGCIGAKPEASGQYTFAGTDSLAHQIEGKGIRKFAGRWVELVFGPPGKGLTVRPGLWPPPSGGARGVALGPSHAAILRQRGGGGAGVGAAEDVVSAVSRVRRLPGICK